MATNRVGEIEEEEEATPLIPSPEPVPSLQKTRSLREKVPEAELHVYKQGKGPIDVYKTGLGGYDQDQLEVREVLDKYGFKSVYAYNPGSGRSLPIRFNPRNGRSLLTYKDGAVIYIDGEPKRQAHRALTWAPCLFKGSEASACALPLGCTFDKHDSLLNPITKILLGVLFITFMITIVMKETPTWAKKLNFSGGRIPPWILACVVIVFTRMRKRTKSFLEKLF